MSGPATGTEAQAITRLLSPWQLYLFTTDMHGIAAREERTHGHCGDGWRCHGTPAGIAWSYTPSYGEPPAAQGVVPWRRVREVILGAATPAQLAELGEAVAAYNEAWRVGPARHVAEAARRYRRMEALADAICDTIRDTHPVGQLDMLDLLAGAR